MISNAVLDRTLYIYMVVVLLTFSLVASGSLFNVSNAYGSSGYLALLASGAHIFFGVLYVLGPMAQFNPKLRKNHPGIHRWIGRLTLIAMLAATVFGLLMNFAPGNTQFELGMRTIAMFLIFWVPLCAYKAFTAARIRNFKLHQIWVIRLAAVAVGNGALRFGILGFIITNGSDDGINDFVDQTIWFFIAGHCLLAELYIQHRFFGGLAITPKSA